ncbi:50S ribosomal protein L29 [Desulfobacterota bacterium AH_259_B03_O07]|nr:50S ribosomal protein L29 [Desulfobacterota bacterium AH_259_B03_O07]
MTKPGEFREMGDDELRNREADTREELFNLRVQIATQQTTNVSRVKSLRRDLARILTMLGERKRGNKE